MTFKTVYPAKEKAKVVDEEEETTSPSTRAFDKSTLTTGSKKRDESWRRVSEWRREHDDQELPDVVTNYKDGKSAGSGHHCPDCHRVLTNRCFKKGHVGTCPCCSQIVSALHGCDKCKTYGVTKDDLIELPPHGWTATNGTDSDLVEAANGKKNRTDQPGGRNAGGRPKLKLLERVKGR